MKKKIGILGGFSYESTIQYYDNLMRLYYERFHDYYYPEVVIYSMDFQKFTDMENENRMDDYRAYILESIHALKAAGVDFAGVATGTTSAEELRQYPSIGVYQNLGELRQVLNVRREEMTVDGEDYDSRSKRK